MITLQPFVNVNASQRPPMEEDNGLALLNDLNVIVKAFNAFTKNTPFEFYYKINDSITPALVTMAALGSTCSCADCGPANNCSGCPPANTSAFYKCAAAGATINSAVAGVYTLTLDPNVSFTNSVVTFGPMTNGSAGVFITKNSETSYTITGITNATGIATANLLNGVVLKVILLP